MSMTEPPDLDIAPRVDHTPPEGVPAGQLKRVIGFWGITFYGLGGIIGAGIFATIGAIAGRAGVYAPIAFVVAAIPALFAALSYGQLVRRVPKAGGEAAYVQTAYGTMWLTRMTTLGVAMSGIVSAATLLVAFSGYVGAVAPVPALVTMVVLALTSVVLAGIGVSLSSGAVVLITLVEVGLLLLISIVGWGELAAWPAAMAASTPPADLGFILAASAVIAFFSFVGFEDVVNMAEEVKDAPRILPQALLLAFGLSLILYIVVTAIAVVAVPSNVLATSGEPLGEVANAQGVLPNWAMSFLAMASIGNGVIIQVNMVSRLLYGLSESGGAPDWLGRLHYKTGTPLGAIALTGSVILFFALILPLAKLAELTSVILLLVFALVQTALIVILKREHASKASYFVPMAGCVSACLLLIGAFV